MARHRNPGKGTTADGDTRGGLHVAVIMDGNGRWATARGLPRVAGHRAGARAVRRTVEASPDLGVSTLTLYAFSSDNWNRPRQEVDALMRLLRNYLRRETARAVENGVRVRMIGRRDRLDHDVVAAMEAAEQATANGATLHLRIAVEYSARDVIARAAALHRDAEPPSRERFREMMAEASHAADPCPDVDLLIRTGGEQRLSDFLLWECAYAELLFLPVMWPDFGKRDLARAVEEGTFRRDLYYRLNAVTIRLPALRERREDMPLLTEHFLKRHGRAAGRVVSGFSSTARTLMDRYGWPGNVRELSHVIERAIALAKGPQIEAEDLPAHFRAEPRAGGTPTSQSLEEVERAHILAILRSVGGSRVRAAAILGIDRKTLYRKLLRYGLAEDHPEP